MASELDDSMYENSEDDVVSPGVGGGDYSDDDDYHDDDYNDGGGGGVLDTRGGAASPGSATASPYSVGSVGTYPTESSFADDGSQQSGAVRRRLALDRGSPSNPDGIGDHRFSAMSSSTCLSSPESPETSLGSTPTSPLGSLEHPGAMPIGSTPLGSPGPSAYSPGPYSAASSSLRSSSVSSAALFSDALPAGGGAGGREIEPDDTELLRKLEGANTL